MNNLAYFKNICSRENILQAYFNASRHKRSSTSFLYFRSNQNENLRRIQNQLLELTWQPGKYKQFKISDPKERLITAAPFEDRIVHHAIINVLEPVFEKQFIFHTYACRKNKGTHAALKFAGRYCQKNLYFLKLDVRKYFDSVSQDILKLQLKKLIKDNSAVYLLEKIIDSYEVTPGKGLPIGNLTSQYFANLYLSGLDHYVLEKLHPVTYIRYMDDMLIISSSIEKLKDIYGMMELYLSENLRLELKTPVYGRCDCGIPFLGKLITKKSIKPLSEKKRLKRKKIKQIDYLVQKGDLNQQKAQERITAILADMNI